VHFADPMRDPRVIEDALGRRRLSGVDVRHDSDVPATIKRYLSRHDLLSLLLADFFSPRLLFPARLQPSDPGFGAFANLLTR
jgi:hypothetical protein